MEKGKVVISIVIFFITVMLISLMFIQFRTVEESNLLGIETMREEELRQEILEWKTKYGEIDEKLQSNNEKIKEYTDIITNNKQASDLLDAELKEYNMLVGKTNVIGNGVVIKLSDTQYMSYTASNLVYLVNELKYAGAEAISINNQRITNMTEIVSINEQYILVNGERIVSPYEVKAIGNQEQFDKILNFPESGFIGDYKNKGYTIELNMQSGIRIPAYNQPIELKYIKEAE